MVEKGFLAALTRKKTIGF